MTISRGKQVTVRVMVTMLFSLVGFNALAESGTYVVQYEVGFGGKHITSNLYLGSEPGFIADAMCPL
jgi:hypothetical protein